MKTQTPYHRSVHFRFCTQSGCLLMMMLLALGGLPSATRAEQPKARRGKDAGHNRKAMPPITQEDEATDPPLPGSGIFSPATVISAPFGTSFQVNVSGGQNMAGDAANEPSMCMHPDNPNRIAI